MFAPYLRMWNLRPDGEPIHTRAARLLPVRQLGVPAMLRLSLDDEGRDGDALMQWWDGQGAARVLAHAPRVLLLERATGQASLAALARSGRDDEACRILCATLAKLHAPRAKPLPALLSLETLFQDLTRAAPKHGGLLPRCADAARALLADPREQVVLHGDLHHDNVLDFGARGWLAIDPKGLRGERAFDYANIFTNPDLADPTQPVATDPARFARRLDVVATASNLDRRRLLSWILAWTGLSAAWFLEDRDPLAAIDLRVAALAAAELDR